MFTLVVEIRNKIVYIEMASPGVFVIMPFEYYFV